MRSDGLLALTGNRGRLFRIADDGAYADMGHLEAQQGMSLAVVPSAGASDTSAALVIGTANTGKLYRFGAAASTHEYASDVAGRRRVGPFRPRRSAARIDRLRALDPLRQRGTAGARLVGLAAIERRCRRFAPQAASCSGKRCCIPAEP